jgi:hypothetical protein
MDVLRCDWCGDDFDSRNRNYKYCSPRCREEAKKEYMEKFHADPKNSERKNELRKGKYWSEPEYRKAELRKSALRLYKWTPEKYDAKLLEQGGHCALCDNVAGKKRLHVDHDHACCGDDKKFTCGKCNRGILCQVCNTRLGYLEQLLKDFPFERQDQAEIYLRNSVRQDSWTYRALKYLKQYTA